MSMNNFQLYFLIWLTLVLITCFIWLIWAINLKYDPTIIESKLYSKYMKQPDKGQYLSIENVKKISENNKQYITALAIMRDQSDGKQISSELIKLEIKENCVLSDVSCIT